MLYNILSGYTLGYTLGKRFHFKCNLTPVIYDFPYLYINNIYYLPKIHSPHEYIFQFTRF